MPSSQLDWVSLFGDYTEFFGLCGFGQAVNAIDVVVHQIGDKFIQTAYKAMVEVMLYLGANPAVGFDRVEGKEAKCWGDMLRHKAFLW